ncbi:hypothetical protein ACYYMC_000242 [Escherichia coli]|nr:hypothetical protein [Escherichia coli]MBJ9597919.1 hypothetical protein [Citrobacter werkmanii]HEB0857120.1 hypothetical protein [Citrobacter freundii]EHH4474957.1 hypothetical protein [Escherichia coli]EID8851285.1 hypothetical protein [Escherichia coli]
MRHNFSSDTVRKLAERAAYICSNPKCNRITVGPDQNPSKSTKTGVAAHIAAASPNGPRYDMSQSERDRKSISNAIWLCATCSVLIDKNNGTAYEAPELKKWKKDHESLVKECLEGALKISFSTLQHALNNDEKAKCQEIIYILEDKGVLYIPFNGENSIHVIDSLKELRTVLTTFKASIPRNSPLFLICESMINACRHYMNTTSINATIPEMEYSLGAVRKIFGVNIKQMVEIYGVRINNNLSDLLPE